MRHWWSYWSLSVRRRWLTWYYGIDRGELAEPDRPVMRGRPIVIGLAVGMLLWTIIGVVVWVAVS